MPSLLKYRLKSLGVKEHCESYVCVCMHINMNKDIEIDG
jgi:hypothetical protein